MSDLRTSPIPAWLVPEDPVDRSLELKTAFNIPFHFSTLEVPPLSIGTAALLEVGFVDVFRTQNIGDAFGVAKLLYALVNREKCAPLFFEWREWMESDEGIEFNVEDVSTYHDLDFKIDKFAIEHKIFDEDNYIPEKILKLFEFVYISFNGFLMIPENQHKESKWWFDMPSIASQIISTSGSLNITYFDALWRFPVSMTSHIASQNMKANGVKYIERPPCKAFIDEFREIILKRELKGNLHPWQRKEPYRYELSQMQVQLHPSLVDRFINLRKSYDNMSDKKKEAHLEKYHQIMIDEVLTIKKKIGLK